MGKPTKADSTLHTIDLSTVLKLVEEGSILYSATRTAAFLESCRVCLGRSTHSNPVHLDILSHKNDKIVWEIQWQPELFSDLTNNSLDQYEAPEEGAVCIAFLLVFVLTEYTIVHRSRVGTGFDFWLGYKGEPKQYACRLEVSGIMKGEEADIKKRLRTKVEQTKQSDGETHVPAIAIVVEFSRPHARMNERSVA